MFKPMLAPNESVDLDNINYPILASYKLDGIRCIFKNGEMLSRSLKNIQNKQLREKFKSLIEYSKINNVILDGEIYSPKLSFQDITKFVMTKDFNDPKSIKKHGEALTIPEHLKFHCFDIVTKDCFGEVFNLRRNAVTKVNFGNSNDFKNIFHAVPQFEMKSREDVESLFKIALEDGVEGLILKSMEGRYKTGRGTLKEGLIYKVKPFVTFDAKIIRVVQTTEVNPNAEKTINELGRSVTSKKKGDRIPINRASAFEVMYEDLIVKPVLAMTNEEKDEIWANKESYIGKTIEYKGMLVGAKDVPRHPVMIRFREDK